MEENLRKNSLLKQFNVSRETCLDFDRFISMIIDKNKEINIISMKNANETMIWERHIVDSVQVIDFIDLNCNTTTDLGSGGGFPGIILAMMIKNLKRDVKVILYEKSHHKSSFLREVSRKLNLDTEVIQKDIFETKELNPGSIVARAFKPLPVVLELVYKNFSNYKNLILFMGKSGGKILEETLEDWELDFEKKKSVTNEDSFLLNIKNIKKRSEN
tara:strand:- start:1708 stop:2355 length:648 start_codon:yes stop_codon:yes gene_type:complete